ncbi:hypothetical protein GCM10007876_29050 [Litoribrevibacter albus]|uniref:Uncharacterized protein n=1 Tax=Litoribrevibacter albus TaxID=1473156 RepID=A0AA37W9B2_9GAMM|nr:hypothetical protein GCM10007876_29050 [Litoribrevibacter albus]
MVAYGPGSNVEKSKIFKPLSGLDMKRTLLLMGVRLDRFRVEDRSVAEYDRSDLFV